MCATWTAPSTDTECTWLYQVCMMLEHQASFSRKQERIDNVLPHSTELSDVEGWLGSAFCCRTLPSRERGFNFKPLGIVQGIRTIQERQEEKLRIVALCDVNCRKEVRVSAVLEQVESSSTWWLERLRWDFIRSHCSACYCCSENAACLTVWLSEHLSLSELRTAVNETSGESEEAAAWSERMGATSKACDYVGAAILWQPSCSLTSPSKANIAACLEFQLFC